MIINKIFTIEAMLLDRCYTFSKRLAFHADRLLLDIRLIPRLPLGSVVGYDVIVIFSGSSLLPGIETFNDVNDMMTS